MNREDEKFTDLFGKADIPDADTGFSDRLEKDLQDIRPEPASPRRFVSLLAFAAAAVVALTATVYIAQPWDLPKEAKPVETGAVGKKEEPKPMGDLEKDRKGPDTSPNAQANPPQGPGEVLTKKKDPALVGIEIPVRYSPPRKMRERELFLMELIKASDVVLAGRFIEGGHGNAFVVEEVLKGNRTARIENLLTNNGLVCPRSANPRKGSWAVAFGSFKKDAVVIQSGQWLKQFRFEGEWRSFIEKVKAYLQGAVIPKLVEELRQAALEAAKGAGRDDTRTDMKEMAEFMKVMKEIMERVGPQGPKKIREELAKWLATKDPQTRERFRSMMDSQSGHRESNRASIRELVTDLRKSGNLEAIAGLMHVYVDVPRSIGSARILLALGVMKLGRTRARAKIDFDREVERMEWISTKLGEVNARLGNVLSVPIERNEIALRRAAFELREALLCFSVMDSTSTPEHRTCALEAMIKVAPGALAMEEVLEIVKDGSRMHPTRLRALKLCVSRKIVEALPALLRILREVPTVGNGPPPGESYFYGKVSGFSLKVEAIGALGKLGDGAAASELIALLQEPAVPGSSMRSWIAGALADLNAVDAVPVLESMLANENSLDQTDRNGILRALKRLRK